MFEFRKARRQQRKLRVAIDGPSGAGKTFSLLRLAFSLVRNGLASKVAVIDSENDSASLYAGESPDGVPWDFDTLNLKEFGPDQYTAAIRAAVKAGYDAVIVDSLSHAWVGKGGALDVVDQKGGNKFAAWKDVTPIHREMVDTIIRAPAHMLVSMRSKTEYVVEENEKGQKVPRKIGMAPVQREGMEFEFDVYGTMDWSHQIKVTKSRCSAIQDATAIKPGPAFWQPVFDWLTTAAPSDPAAFQEQAAPRPAQEVEDDLRAGIEAAATETALADAAKRVADAFAKGEIRQANKDRLTPTYKKRLAELKAAAAGGAAPESKSA